jgi:hypothetical protein
MSVFALDLVARKSLKDGAQKLRNHVAAKRDAIKTEREALKAELNDKAPQE